MRYRGGRPANQAGRPIAESGDVHASGSLRSIVRR